MELPYQDPRSVFFDDITYELSVLIERRPFSEKKGYRLEPYGYAAYEDILNMLGSLHCQYLPVFFFFLWDLY